MQDIFCMCLTLYFSFCCLTQYFMTVFESNRINYLNSAAESPSIRCCSTWDQIWWEKVLCSFFFFLYYFLCVKCGVIIQKVRTLTSWCFCPNISAQGSWLKSWCSWFWSVTSEPHGSPLDLPVHVLLVLSCSSSSWLPFFLIFVPPPHSSSLLTQFCRELHSWNTQESRLNIGTGSFQTWTVLVLDLEPVPFQDLNSFINPWDYIKI